MTRPAPTLAPDRLEQLLTRLPGARVTVVGDIILDRYLLGDTHRLSPEAPVPVVELEERRLALGGAANVAANVTAVGARVRLVGLVGDDSEGREVREAMRAAWIDDADLLEIAGRPTTTKTRVVVRGQQLCRIDDEVDHFPEAADLARLEALALAALEGADVLLLEDYNKGCLAPGVIAACIGAARARGIPVVVDPKFRQFFDFRGATVFKPNRRELEAALGAEVNLAHPDALPSVLGRIGAEHLLLTLGADGMALVSADGTVHRIPSRAREVFDVSGAGDTVTAWVGMALAAGASHVEAAILANYAAGVEVGKAGVATVALEEIRGVVGA